MAHSKRRQLSFFIVIGVLNTLIDFAIYLIMLRLTDSIVLSNIVATSIALVVSFALNSKLTFQMQGFGIGRFMAYIAVTLFGLWVLQTGVIYLLTKPVAALPAGLFALFGPAALQVQQLLPKLIATPVSLVWNYLWYSRVIFKKT